MPAKWKMKVKRPRPAAVVSSCTPTPSPDPLKQEEPETEGMFPDPLDPSSSQADQPILPSSLPSSQPDAALSCEQSAFHEKSKPLLLFSEQEDDLVEWLKENPCLFSKKLNDYKNIERRSPYGKKRELRCL